MGFPATKIDGSNPSDWGPQKMDARDLSFELGPRKCEVDNVGDFTDGTEYVSKDLVRVTYSRTPGN